MKQAITIILLGLFCIFASAQERVVRYSYDTAGNCVSKAVYVEEAMLPYEIAKPLVEVQGREIAASALRNKWNDLTINEQQNNRLSNETETRHCIAIRTKNNEIRNSK